jgi:tetratricopeptide (TPR) repeat protein
LLCRLGINLLLTVIFDSGRGLFSVVISLNRAAKRQHKKLARKAVKNRRGHPPKLLGQGPGGAAANQISELVQQAIQFHQAGRIQEAEAIYRRVLDTDPDHADANYLLGVLLVQGGDHARAVESISRAIAAAPNQPLYHHFLGSAFQKLQRWDDAVASYRQALAIKPDYADAHNNLGNVLQQLGRLDDAVASYRQALAVKPDSAEAHNNLGFALQKLGRMDDAVASYRQALAIKPDYIQAHNNLGFALHKLERLDDAVASYRQVLAIEPDYAEAHNNLGNVVQKLGRLEDAAISYRKALAIKPDYAEAHYNLGFLLVAMGRIEEAIASCHQALATRPEFADAWHILKIAAKAHHYSNGRHVSHAPGDRTDDLYKDGLGPAARATSNFALLEYYLAAFRPREAGESFEKAVAALPPKTDQEVIVSGTGRGAAKPPRLPDKLVALLHFGRSGTGLLHGLIDGHPEISTLPSIYLRGFFNAGVWEKIAAEGWRRLPERFADEFSVLFDATSPKPTPGSLGEIISNLGVKEGMTALGEGRDESLSLDRDRFCAEAIEMMQQHEKIDPGLFFTIVHGAFEKTIGTQAEKHTLFYHIHNPDDFAKLNFMRYAPDARLIIMVREPIQCCESWIRVPFEENDYDRVSAHIFAMLFAIDQIAFRTLDSVGIRLEDLKKRPEATLRGLCAWMGVDETPSLYQTTAQGKKWWGDPSSPIYEESKSKSPFDDAPIRRAVGTIFSDQDQLILRTLFYPFSVRFGYREPDPVAFKKNLREIRPLLDDMLDFERAMSKNSGIDPTQFKRNGAYMLLRASLLDRWDVLEEFGDYPNMLTPLAIGRDP